MKAVTKPEFDRLMKRAGPWPARPFVAVAASGGRDSLALCLLMDAWVRARRGRLVVLTVDHGLRRESAAEANALLKMLKERGIACEILRWRGAKPKTGVQAAAREARYALLLARCRKLGVEALTLAHQEEDQAETLLIRILGGSGLDGLCGMQVRTRRGDVDIIRPLLSVSRARLGATCLKSGLDWTDDPSNENMDYCRVRVRNFLEAEGGDAAHRVALVAGKLASVRDFLDEETLKGADRAVVAGNGRKDRGLDLEQWRLLHGEVRRRVLLSLIAGVSGGVYPPREERLAALADALMKPGFRGRTLAGCQFLAEKEGIVFINKEKPVRVKKLFNK